MTPLLASYAEDRWYTAEDAGVAVLDSSTGEPVAMVSATGLDVAGMVRHARTVGGPALRALTFHQRARILADLAGYLTERKEQLYVESARSGATVGDSQVDVDGGIGVLAVYARKAIREMPDDTIYVEGPRPERLGRGGTFLGQTIYTSRTGVAVFIDAFNFPVWGMLEKLAPALLAGLPVIVKPATPTAHVAARAFRMIVESGLLPAGSVQLIAGSVGDLLDHLDGQDGVAFTGSEATAARLRVHPAIAERSVRFAVEADSLNASILGPDAVPGTEEFTLYIRAVVREMTQKTGQKCTAIRRCLVPEPLVDEVIRALDERLAGVTIGDPRTEGTRMGPLVGRSQCEEVAAATRELMRTADLVVGGPDASAGPENDGDGAFFAPTVLRARDSDRPETHRIEAFGPVTTVFGYRDAAHAVRLVALGSGSLVASVISHDPTFVKDVVAGIAPFHGRILILDRDDAKEAPPHGAVLPHLIHGGPGRAGGGEELGGIRSVLHQMQATSVTGSPAMLVATTGRWNTFAPQRIDEVHPFRKYFEELRVGDTLITGTRTVTLADIEHFADFTGDTFYAHTDDEAATANPIFHGRVAHGYLVLAFAAGLFVDPAPGPVLANFGLERLRFVNPVRPGDTIGVRLTCQEKNTRPDADYGEVRWDVAVTNQDGDLVAAYQLLTLNAYVPRN